MIRKLKNILKESEQLNYIASWCYRLLHNLDHSHRRVACKGAYLKNTTFSITEGSEVEIGNLARLRNCSFSINGKNCRIVIGGGKDRNLQYVFLL